MIDYILSYVHEFNISNNSKNKIKVEIKNQKKGEVFFCRFFIRIFILPRAFLFDNESAIYHNIKKKKMNIFSVQYGIYAHILI